MNPAYEVYAVASAIYFATLLIVVVKLRGMFTPFHICLLFFSAELYLAAFPLMIDDAYGRTHITAPLGETQIMVLGSAILLLLASLFMRRGREYDLTRYQIVVRVPRQLLMLGLAAVSAYSSFSSYRKLGNFPLFVIAHESASYSEVFEGFVTFLGWGTARALAVWFVMELATNTLSVRRFIVRHGLLIGCTAAALFFNVLDGQRNMLILPILLATFALSRKGAIQSRHLVAAGSIILVFFIALGTFRGGQSRSSSRVKYITGQESLDNSLGNIVTYLEPNIHNLNNLVSLHPQPYHGKILLYEALPDSLLNLYFTDPITAVDRLEQERFLSHPGLTFRTVFADFYADFGAIGSLLFGTVYYAFAVLCFNKAPFRPRYMLIYLILAQGILYFPFMNILMGIPAIVQLTLLFFLRYEVVDEQGEVAT